jgi:hypothetical protein
MHQNQDGEVLDILVQPRRDKRAAERFLRKLLKSLNPKFKSEGPDEPKPLTKSVEIIQGTGLA